MDQEKRIFDGVLFCPGDAKLKAIKARSHHLSALYTRSMEEEEDLRNELLEQILGELPEGIRIQGPLFFHYGVHTKIGKRFFGNYNLTIQDDAPVTIGDDCNFGPNVTIATAGHPVLPELREKGYQYNVPVHIGRNCWLGAGVIVLPGVTIGDNTVIGAGRIVTKDIPANVVAVGNPCRVLREIGQKDRETYFRGRPIDWDALNANNP